jgi:hypothetical protein
MASGCSPRRADKQPLIKGGCKSASDDPELIRAWARQMPWANAAGAAGHAYWVLDVDAKGARDGFLDLDELSDQHGELPRTWTVATPSGGQHLYFARPGAGYHWRNWPAERRFTNSAPLRIDGVKSGSTSATWARQPPCRRRESLGRVRLDGALHGIVRWRDARLAAEAGRPGPRRPLPRRAAAEPRRLGPTVRYVEAAVNGECGELALDEAR